MIQGTQNRRQSSILTAEKALKMTACQIWLRAECKLLSYALEGINAIEPKRAAESPPAGPKGHRHMDPPMWPALI